VLNFVLAFRTTRKNHYENGSTAKGIHDNTRHYIVCK